MTLPLISDLVGQQSIYTGTGNFGLNQVNGQNTFCRNSLSDLLSIITYKTLQRP